jgi:hypothetical protein
MMGVSHKSAFITVENTTRSCTLVERCELANSFLSRLRGLMGRRSLEPGQGLLIYPESSIHMFFMRFPIDAVFVDKHDMVLSLHPELQPNRSFASKWGARYVLELPAGVIAQSGTQVGDQLALNPSPHRRKGGT